MTEKLMIRDDGLMAHFTIGLAANPRWKPYVEPVVTGTLEVEQVISQELGGDEPVVSVDFDVTTASKDELIRYAESVLNLKIDRRRGEEGIREELMDILG